MEAGNGILASEAARWDFVDTFPAPLPAAVDAGNLVPEDASGTNLAALTRGHAADCRAVLDRERTLLDAARRDVYPDTGKRPQTEKARHKNRQDVAHRAELCRQRYDGLLASYADTFGAAAAEAFRAHVEGVPAEEVQPALPTEDAESTAALPPALRTTGPQLDLFG